MFNRLCRISRILIACLAISAPLVVLAVEPTPDQAERVSTRRVEIKFQLHAPGLDRKETVFITGSIPELGNWDPRAVPMKSAGKDRWEFRLQCKATPLIEYKFTLGSWDREGADDVGNPLANFSVDARKDAKQNHQIGFWKETHQRKVIGQITGTIRYHEHPGTAKLRERQIVVWLPPNYKDSEDRFPVLYMQDGQNLFDPATSAFGIDWKIDETCTELIAAGDIPPLIVVGIYNTPNRSREYVPGKLGSAYQKLVVEEIKPMIEKRYRTQTDREHTFIGGSSAGGICAFSLAWDYPQVFSKALCFSPYFQAVPGSDAKLDYPQTIEQSPNPEQPLTFYLDNGGVGLEKLLQPGIDSMLKVLKKKGFQRDRSLHWRHAPEDRHSESAWAKRFPEAVKLLFNEH